MISPPGTSPSSSIWGEGQRRQCRDWNKLEKWAEVRYACQFLYVYEMQGVRAMVDRYKWCLKNSPYGKTMRDVLGFAEEGGSQATRVIDGLPACWEGF